MIQKIIIILCVFTLLISVGFAQSQQDLILEARGQVPHWKVSQSYDINDFVSYEEKVYRVIQSHTSQVSWKPDNTPALFVEHSFQNIGEIPLFSQPSGSHDAYKKGYYVKYNGYIFKSLIDENVWSPSNHPQGWEEIGQSPNGDIITIEDTFTFNKYIGIDGLQGQESLHFDRGILSVENAYTGNYTVYMYTGTHNITHQIYKYENITQNIPHVLSHGYLYKEVVSNDGFVTFETDGFSTLVNPLPTMVYDINDLDFGLGLDFFFDDFDRVEVIVREDSHVGSVVSTLEVGEGNNVGSMFENNLDIDIALTYTSPDNAEIMFYPKGIVAKYYLEITVRDSPLSGATDWMTIETEDQSPPPQNDPPTQTASIPSITLDTNDDDSFNLGNFFNDYDYFSVSYTDNELGASVTLNNEQGFSDSGTGEIYTSINTFHQVYIESFGFEFNNKQISVTAHNAYGTSSDTFDLTVDDQSSTPPPNTGTLEESTIAYYTFDENTGTVAGDSAGSNDGTLQGNVDWTVSGKINTALNFPKGSNDYVSTSLTPAVDSFSIGGWVKVDNTVRSGIFSTVDDSGTRNGFYLATDSGNQILPTFFRDGSFIGSTSGYYTHSSSLVDEWIHIILVYEHGSTDAQQTLYFNGVEVTSITLNGQLTSFQEPLWIGSEQQSQTARRFGGDIDEVAIFDKALSQEEIEFLYASGSPTEEQQYPYISVDPPTQDASFVLTTLEFGETETWNLGDFFSDVDTYSVEYYDADTEQLEQAPFSSDYISSSIDIGIFLTLTAGSIELSDNTFTVSACNAGGCISDDLVVSIVEPQPDIPIQDASFTIQNLGFNQELTLNLDNFFTNADFYIVQYYDADTEQLEQAPFSSDYLDVSLPLGKFLKIESQEIEYFDNEFNITACNEDGCISTIMVLNVVDVIIQSVTDFSITAGDVLVIDFQDYFKDYEDLTVFAETPCEVQFESLGFLSPLLLQNNCNNLVSDGDSIVTQYYTLSFDNDILTIDTGVFEDTEPHIEEIKVLIGIPSSMLSVIEEFSVTINPEGVTSTPGTVTPIEDGYLNFLTSSFGSFFPDAETLSLAQRMLLVLFVIGFLLGMVIYIGTTRDVNMSLLTAISSMVLFFSIVFFTVIGYIPISIIVLATIFTIIGVGIFIRNKLFGVASPDI